MGIEMGEKSSLISATATMKSHDEMYGELLI